MSLFALVTLDTTVYGSMDFAHWYTIGPQAGFHQGECQSFFPTPRSTPGSAPAPPLIGGLNVILKRNAFGRQSKSIDVERQRCARCHGTLRLLGSFNRDGTPYKPRAPMLAKVLAPLLPAESTLAAFVDEAGNVNADLCARLVARCLYFLV